MTTRKIAERFSVELTQVPVEADAKPSESDTFWTS